MIIMPKIKLKEKTRDNDELEETSKKIFEWGCLIGWSPYDGDVGGNEPRQTKIRNKNTQNLIKESTRKNIMTTETETTKSPGRPRTKITDGQLDQAAVLYNKGWSVERIVSTKKAGKSTATAWAEVEVANLYHHLRQRDDVEMRGKGRLGLTDEQKALVVESYESGMTMGKIQNLSALVRRRKVSGKEKRIKFSLPTIAKALHEAGVEVRRGRPAKVQPEEAAE